MAKFNSRPNEDWHISYDGIAYGNNQGVTKVQKAKQANWPMLYDDNCMAVCECLGIHDTKSAEFTFRSFM